MVMTGRHLTRRKTFREDFKSAFLTGVAALLPTILTLLIVVKALEFVDWHIGRHIRAGLLYIVFQAVGPERIADLLGESPQTPAGELYEVFHTAYASEWYLVVLSFLVAITLVYFVGFLVASVVGRAVSRLVEAGIVRLPGIRSVYPYVKQVTDILFTTRTIQDFNRVVAVEYPRGGIYSLGLVTSTGLRAVREATDEERVCIFIPSSPTPLTGYTIMVRAQDIIDLPLTVDQAFKFVISGGVIVPKDQVVAIADSRVLTGEVDTGEEVEEEEEEADDENGD